MHQEDDDANYSKPSREPNILDKLQKLAFENAKKKGWDEPLSEAKSFGDWVALMHSEISEAYEDYRDGHKLNEIYFEFTNSQGTLKYSADEVEELWVKEPWVKEPVFAASLKPCGIPIEMADEVIRILHLAEFAGFNLYNMIELKMQYNTRRSFRHGGKKT